MTQTTMRSAAPPPDLTISEWADRYRRLSPESSAEPGQWMTRRAEYQRGMMDAVYNEKLALMRSKHDATHNRLALARDSLRGFAGGGPVEALRASMTSVGSSGFRIATAGLAGAAAGGGAVSARQSFDLVIDGQRYSGLSAAIDTAAELQKSAMRKRVSSAGRAPNWQGVR